jgi:hypothetical protein
MLRSRLLPSLAGDRGDVPGWVLITLMTAGLLASPIRSATARREALHPKVAGRLISENIDPALYRKSKAAAERAAARERG